MDARLAARLAEKHAQLSAQRPLTPATLRLLAEELRSLLTYHSNAIEGNTLSLRETQLVLEQGVTIAGHSLREHLEATNHAEALDWVQSLADHEQPITISTILALHQLVMAKLLDPVLVGAFRPMAVHIAGAQFTPPPARDVPALMQQWCDWITAEGMAYPPIIRAAIAHHGFVAVHPFRDGNGRTGRLLLNLLLMRSGYPPAFLLQEWRIGYLQALSLADRGRYTPLVNLIGRAVELGLDHYLEACTRTPVDAIDDLIPLDELAAQTGHTAEYLALLIRKGRVAGRKHGHRWYSSRAAVTRYQQEVANNSVRRGRPPKQAGG
jgi:Fic family protein